MKEETKTKLLLFALASLIIVMFMSAIFMYGLSRELRKAKSYVEEVVTKTDTVYVIDTIKISEPNVSETIELGSTVATLEVVEPIILDSIKDRYTDVIVPIEQKIYSDSTFTAYVSGYQASLDSIHLFLQTEKITITNEVPAVKIKPKPKRWGVGVQVGCIGYKNKIEPYLGIGVSYNVFVW